MHQSLQAVPGATVLSYYRALGGLPEGRRLLLQKTWAAWRDDILAELSVAHPDLAAKTSRIDISRYGHAMAIPTPRNSGQLPLPLSSMAHRQPQNSERSAITHERLSFAHSDWAGYSVFEEAFTMGHNAA